MPIYGSSFSFNFVGVGSDDPDLGSPNRRCHPKGHPDRGPGRGKGGFPGAAFPNCEPLGNLLIIQDDNRNTPNDLAAGGRINIEFNKRSTINSFGLLDVEEGALVVVSMHPRVSFVN